MVNKSSFMMRCIAAAALYFGVLHATAVSAASIDILWYTGGVVADGGVLTGTYSGGIDTLISKNEDAKSGGVISSTNTWNSITYWSGGAMPAGDFDVLVTASRVGFWDVSPDYTDLNSWLGGATLGDRVMVSGQDADWHYIQYAEHQATFDSSQGFLIDAINWAASGSGMGAVFLAPEATTLAFLGGLGTHVDGHVDSVVIPAAMASFPINEGLTSAGLSNWFEASHDRWQDWDPILWSGINMWDNENSGLAVTLVTAANAGGDTSKGGGTGVPEPGTLALFGVGLAVLGFARRRWRT